MKKLISLIGGLMLATSAQADDGLLNQVQDSLGDHGLPRTEFFQRHQVTAQPSGYFTYDQWYLVNGRPLLARFVPYTPQITEGNEAIFSLDNGADLYFYNGRWYEDPNVDGINGNEELYQNN